MLEKSHCLNRNKEENTNFLEHANEQLNYSNFIGKIPKNSSAIECCPETEITKGHAKPERGYFVKKTARNGIKTWKTIKQ